MSIASTCSDLRRWGREGRKFGDLGYPSIVAFMKIRLGRSSATPPETDPVIDQIEGIVSRAPTEIRELLILYYCQGATIRRIAAVKSKTKYQVCKFLNESQWYVHTELERFDFSDRKAYTRIA